MYRLKRITAWCGHATEPLTEDSWLDLLDDFGPVLLRFLLDEDRLDRLPESDAVLKAFKKEAQGKRLSSLKPDRGSVWILFVRKELLTGLPDCFRSEGFLLPFEWVRLDDGDDDQTACVPRKLLELSERVKAQFGAVAASYVLRPSRCFGGQVDLCLDEAGFESAWGALACGLYLALNPGCSLVEWPFSSVAFDFEKNEPSDVGELSSKFLLASSFGAEEFAVAPIQYVKAERELRALKILHPENRNLCRLELFKWQWTGTVGTSLPNLVRCNQQNARRRFWRNQLLNILILGILALGAWWYAADWNAEKVRFFADCTEQWGVPVGIGALNPADLKGRGLSFAFHERGYDSWKPWKRKPVVRRVVAVNGFGGRVSEVPERLSYYAGVEQRFEYTDSGRPNVVVLSDGAGRDFKLLRYVTHDATKADIVVKSEFGKWTEYVDPRLVNEPRRYEFVRDSDGLIVERRAYAKGGSAVAEDDKGVHRRVLCRDSHGRVAKVQNFGWDGERARVDNLGDTQCYSYDANGNVERIECVVNEGVSRTFKRTLDACGNLLSEDEYDAQGHLRLRRKRQYDDAGSWTCEWRFDDKGLKTNGVSQIARRLTYDEQGRLRMEDRRCLDCRGEVVGEGSGVAHQIYKYNGRGLPEIAMDFNVDDRLMRKTVRRYDREGSLCEAILSTGTEDEGAEPKGVARKVIERMRENECDVIIKRWFDAAGRPYPLPGFHHAVERIVCDERGRISDAYLSECTEGYELRHVKFLWDRIGNSAGHAFFDAEDNPVMVASPFRTDEGACCATVRMKCDPAGRCLERSYLDEKGHLTEGPLGIAIMRKGYDAAGNEIRCELFGRDGLPMIPMGGRYSCRETEYDSDGRVRCRREYGLDRSYAEYGYDSRFARVVSECYFNPDGSARMNQQGVERVEYELDGRGNTVKARFCKADGSAILSVDDVAGWCATYDEQANEIERVFIGLQGEVRAGRNGVAMIRYEHDGAGNVLTKTLYDAATNRVENEEGISKCNYIYGPGGCKGELRWDAHDNPITNVCCIFYTRDLVGQIISRKFVYGAADGGLGRIGGWTSEFDSRGNEIERRYVNEKGEPFIYNGLAGWRKSYDGLGRIIEESHLGPDGNVTNISYDVGNLVTGRFLGLVGRKKRIVYDKKGGRIEEYVGSARDVQGGDKGRICYSAKGKINAVEILNPRSEPIAGTCGFARIEYHRDEQGYITEESYWDPEGKPAACAHGYHLMAVTRHEMTGKRQWVEVHFYDTNGLHVAYEDCSALQMIFDREHRPLLVERFKVEMGKVQRMGKICIKYDGEGRIIDVVGSDFEDMPGCHFKVLSHKGQKMTIQATTGQEMRVFTIDEKDKLWHGYLQLQQLRSWLLWR